jgi:hypothetical protein
MKALALLLLVASLAQAQSEEGRGIAGTVESRWQPKKPLLISGAVSLGLLYLANVAAAVVDKDASNSFPNCGAGCGFAYFPPRFEALFMPFIGPFVALANYRNSGEAGTAVLLVADGLAQVASATLIVIGLVGDRPPEKAPWLLSPGASGSPAGATLTVRLP